MESEDTGREVIAETSKFRFKGEFLIFVFPSPRLSFPLDYAVDPFLDFTNLFALMARYLHIVCATLLVGGTLFYEMVVPVAIADLRPEMQLAIFGRARWVFRQIVWWSAALIIISGIVS